MTTALIAAVALCPQQSVPDKVLARGLTDLGAYEMLYDLCTNVGSRLSGSPGAERAVEWTKENMRRLGLQNVHEIPCMVPHWVRGSTERAAMVGVGQLSVCALGGSVATPGGGIEAEVVEVRSLAEATALGERAKGRIIFFNRSFEPTLRETGAAYGGAVDQRTSGASVAAKVGALGVLVRSMTHAKDDVPHTGAVVYDGDFRVPAAALGLLSADTLSAALRAGMVKVRLELDCRWLPDAPSANVAGEITGSEYPDEVILVGGHLDSWDLGDGAHDDGAGIAQSLEALRIIKALGLRPKRTIRAVAFMNEENGLRGGRAYAEYAGKGPSRHIAAIESDAGGFMPREFSVTKEKLGRARAWEPMLRVFGIERFVEGGGGADIGPLAVHGAVLFGLRPDNQRYFDYHHSIKDTIDKVNPRELEFGAMALAVLAWLISEEGFGG